MSLYVTGKSLLNGVDPTLFYRFLEFQKLMDTSGLSTAVLSATHSTPASFLIDAIIALPPAGFSQFVWTAVNLGALVLLVHVSAKLAHSSVRLAYMVFISSSFGLAENFVSAEPFIILTLLFCLGFFAFSTGLERAGGTILGLVFPFELFTAIPALLFLMGKRWRIFIYFLLTSLFIILATYLVLGQSVITYYLQRVFPFYLNAKVQNPFSVSYQTPWSFFRRIFLFDPTLNPNPILASRNACTLAISLFESLVVVPSSYFFYRGVEKKNERECIIAATFPVIFLSPTAITSQLLLLAPAILCLGQALMETQRKTLARVSFILYAIACIPLHSFMSALLNVQTPFLSYEQFFLLLAIYGIYLVSQFELLPRHMLLIRTIFAAVVMAAVTLTLYFGESIQEPAQAVQATLVLTGDQLKNAAFGPTTHGGQISYISLDSSLQNYAVNSALPAGRAIRPLPIELGRDMPGNCFAVSVDASARVFSVELSLGNKIVVRFRTELGDRSYPGRNGSVSREGGHGAFIADGKLFIVDLRSKLIPIVDSIDVLPFKVTQYSFTNEQPFLRSSVEEIALLVDSLNGSKAIATYDIATRRLSIFQSTFSAALIATDGKRFFTTFEDGDSTSVWSQGTDGHPKELFSVRGNIMDIGVVGTADGGYDLYFSSDFERGLNLPTIYKYALPREGI